MSPKTDLDLSIGLELTFVPKCAGKWQEFLSLEDAEFHAALLIKALGRTFKHAKAFLRVKADPFRVVGMNQPHNAWCIEVNTKPFGSTSFITSDALSNTRCSLSVLFYCAAKLNLHPFISKKQRDGTIKEWPTGGGHIHVGLDFLAAQSVSTLALYHIERRMCLDYANYPFIRWLFAQWFDDTNSALPYTLCEISRLASKPINHNTVSDAHEATLSCHSIRQRFFDNGKSVLPTYEFRFFDMPRNVDELKLQVRFLVKWFTYCYDQMADDVRYSLTPAYFKRLSKDSKFARIECETFFHKIGLDFADYTELCWERAYLPRMLHGKAV